MDHLRGKISEDEVFNEIKQNPYQKQRQRARQIEYPNGPFDLIHGETSYQAKQRGEKHVSFEDTNIIQPYEPAGIFENRWEEVHFIHRGWNETPCKTKSQNKKYYRSSFFCNQFDHHSHYFCMICKSKASKDYYLGGPPTETPCECQQ